MSDNTLDLEKAKHMLKFREIYLIFWKDWEQYTSIEYDALEYLVNNSSHIHLPNVRALNEAQINLLKSYKGALTIGYDINKYEA